MYIITNELIQLIKKRQADKLYISQPFGSAIRYKRKELNMTLEEACEDISCISYLSKVENNMIQASDEYVEKFKKRLNLKDAYDYDLESYRIHLDRIIDASLKDEEIDNEMVQYYEDRMDYQSILVSYAYHVLNRKHTDVEKAYKQLVSIVSSMPHESFIISIILINHVLYEEMRYSEGMLILNLIEKQQPYSDTIKLIIRKLQLMHSLKLNHHFLIHKLYQKYASELIEKQLFNQLQKINVQKLIYESRVRTPEDMQEELSKMSEIKQSEKDYIISRCHYFRGSYDKAFNLSKNNYSASNQWLILHLLNLDKLKYKDNIITIMNEIEVAIDPRYELIKKHLFYKYTKDKEEIISYIKREVLNQSFITDDQEILTYFMKDCEKLLSNSQYYKDAVLMYRVFTRKINKFIYA